MADAKQVMIDGVEAMYPRINQTYRFDKAAGEKGKTVPCKPLDENAKYDISFLMDKAKAGALYATMAHVYEEVSAGKDWPEMPRPNKAFKIDAKGMCLATAQIKGQYSGEITKIPLQVDAKNRKLPDDFELTTGSTINIAVVLVPYNTKLGNGVSLRIRGVQVITLAEKIQSSPFDVREGYSGDSALEPEQDLFAPAITGPDTPVTEDDSWGADDSVPAPKKVAKKKEVAAPSSVEADLSSIVDDWDA